MNGNEFFGNLLNLVSVIIGVQNLELNSQQVDQLMSEMRTHQNTMLAEIIEQDKVIIDQNERLLKQNQQLLDLLQKYIDK